QVGSPVRRIPAGECAPLRDAVRGGAVAASRIARGDLPLEQRGGSAGVRTSPGSRPRAAVEEAPPLTCLHCFKPGTDSQFPAQFAGNWLSVGMGLRPAKVHEKLAPRGLRDWWGGPPGPRPMAPVRLLAPCKMLMLLFRQRDEGVLAQRAPRPGGSAPPKQRGGFSTLL